MSKLKNQVVVVTGGASGIGRSLCLDASRRGARVLVADIDGVRAQAVADEIGATGGQAIAAACDVSLLDSVRALAETARKNFGGVNLLCNNAGVFQAGAVHATDPADVRWLFEVNVFGVHHGIHVFLTLLREAAQRGEFAHILNTGSENSLGIPPHGAFGVYNATKHAILALSDNARVDLKKYGVGVSVFCPAAVNTELWNSLSHRPDRLGGPRVLPAEIAEKSKAVLAHANSPDSTARVALDGVEAGDFLILPHPEVRTFTEDRIRMVQAALDQVDRRSAC